MKSSAPGAVLLACLAACSPSEAPAAENRAESPDELVKQLRAEVEALAQKPEHHDPKVTIQHVLVGVSGNPRMPQVTRSAEEAQALAAELLRRARNGEDFDLLVRNHTDDSHPGIYVLVLTGDDPPATFARTQMVPGFGDVAWRLAVGEIGVAPYSGLSGPSPFGYHLIRRLE
jgi:hypothetical protein